MFCVEFSVSMEKFLDMWVKFFDFDVAICVVFLFCFFSVFYANDSQFLFNFDILIYEITNKIKTKFMIE